MPTLPPEPRTQVPKPKLLVVDPARIRLAREARRLSLRLVALACGCSHQRVADLEAGKTATVDLDFALAVSRFLGFPLEDAFATQRDVRASTDLNSARTTLQGGDAA